MKKIVPFNNILTFDTDVKEITAISLEHKFETSSDCVSGVFYIAGDYKITEGQIEKEKFNFELPFDIALGNEYKIDTMVVDIDDFRYELIENNKLKVNIDLYIDGEIIEKEENSENELVDEKPDESSEPILTKIQERLDLLDEMISNVKKDDKIDDVSTYENEDNNVNINNNDNDVTFNAFNEEEKYVTYRVYTLTQNDTLDTVMKKYNISKDELLKYNLLDDINPGVKLIIPYNNND